MTFNCVTLRSPSVLSNHQIQCFPNHLKPISLHKQEEHVVFFEIKTQHVPSNSGTQLASSSGGCVTVMLKQIYVCVRLCLCVCRHRGDIHEAALALFVRSMCADFQRAYRKGPPIWWAHTVATGCSPPLCATSSQPSHTDWVNNNWTWSYDVVFAGIFLDGILSPKSVMKVNYLGRMSVFILKWYPKICLSFLKTLFLSTNSNTFHRSVYE